MVISARDLHELAYFLYCIWLVVLAIFLHSKGCFVTTCALEIFPERKSQYRTSSRYIRKMWTLRFWLVLLKKMNSLIEPLSPIYTICFDRHVSKQTKRHIAHTRVYTVCLTELSLNFSLQNNFLCLHNLNMEEDNFVIHVLASMLVIAAFCLINMNLSVSDGVKLNSSFLFLCRILNQVANFLIETETHQCHAIFFICIIYV